MILSELKGYLQERRQATLSDMALHFRTQPDAIREMLAVWERKGRVRRLPAPAGCGGTCTQCAPGAVEVYVWVEPGERDTGFAVVAGCGH